MASMRGPARLESGSTGGRGGKFSNDPPLRTKLRIARRTSDPIFRSVNPFRTSAPSLIPKQLTIVRKTIEATATTARPEGPIGFPQVDVHSSRPRHHRSKLGHGEGSE